MDITETPIPVGGQRQTMEKTGSLYGGGYSVGVVGGCYMEALNREKGLKVQGRAQSGSNTRNTGL